MQWDEFSIMADLIDKYYTEYNLQLTLWGCSHRLEKDISYAQMQL